MLGPFEESDVHCRLGEPCLLRLSAVLVIVESSVKLMSIVVLVVELIDVDIIVKYRHPSTPCKPIAAPSPPENVARIRC